MLTILPERQAVMSRVRELCADLTKMILLQLSKSRHSLRDGNALLKFVLINIISEPVIGIIRM